MKKILVVGDVMVDVYTTVRVERISPEAPVPIMQQIAMQSVPGGAANVAANVRALGCDVALVGLLGPLGCPTQNSADLFENCVMDVTRCTTVKRRFITESGQQIARLDVEKTHPPDVQIEEELIERALVHAYSADAVIISDYDKGAVTRKLCSEIMKSARGGRVFVDTKRRSWDRFEGASYFTPNMKERARISYVPRGAEVITKMGDKGALIHGFDTVVPAEKVEVGDVTGAGDTFVAALAVWLAKLNPLGKLKKEGIIEMVKFANRAAAVAVSHRGTVAVSESEL